MLVNAENLVVEEKKSPSSAGRRGGVTVGDTSPSPRHRSGLEETKKNVSNRCTVLFGIHVHPTGEAEASSLEVEIGVDAATQIDGVRLLFQRNFNRSVG
jgi:hypothetical protein